MSKSARSSRTLAELQTFTDRQISIRRNPKAVGKNDSSSANDAEK